MVLSFTPFRDTHRAIVFSLVWTPWEGRFNTVFSSPRPGPGSKYLGGKRLLFFPVSHRTGFVGSHRESVDLLVLGFSFASSPGRHRSLLIIAMALVSKQIVM